MSQLHSDCNTLHVGAVKSKFAGLDVVIVPNGTPNRGASGDHLFALWTQIFASCETASQLLFYSFLTDHDAS